VVSGDEVPSDGDPGQLREELRRTRAALVVARREAAQAKAQADAANSVLTEFAAGAPAAIWVADATNGQGIYVSPGVGRVLSVPPEEVLPEAGRWLGLVHPDDRPAVVARFERLRRGDAAEVAYRLLPRSEGAVGATGRAAARWISDLGFPIVDSRGQVRRVAGFAYAADGDGSGGEEGLRRLLLAELNHRVRNALAAVQAVAAQTVRAAPDPRTFWEAFAGRLRAMARTHDMLAGRGWPEGVDLRALVEAELAPFLHAAGPSGPRAEVDGPAVQLKPATAVAMALALHELATNAARHGALSVPTGLVRVTWTLGEPAAPSGNRSAARPMRLEWTESGGPPLARTPVRRGFGARLLTGALPSQLGGRVALDYDPAGLRAMLDTQLPPLEEALYEPQTGAKHKP